MKLGNAGSSGLGAGLFCLTIVGGGSKPVGGGTKGAGLTATSVVLFLESWNKKKAPKATAKQSATPPPMQAMSKGVEMPLGAALSLPDDRPSRLPDFPEEEDLDCRTRSGGALRPRV